MEKLIVLSGKARSGKDTCTKYILDYYKDKKCITVSFAYYLKDYLKRMNLYNEDNKPRTLMQEFGSYLKEKMGNDFLINRLLEDISIFSDKYDIIIVTDCRLKNEIQALKNKYSNCITIRIKRENYEDFLTEKEKKDITEIDLDDFKDFDYYIINNDDLKENIKRCLDE
jgi:hypothetical protein